MQLVKITDKKLLAFIEDMQNGGDERIMKKLRELKKQ